MFSRRYGTDPHLRARDLHGRPASRAKQCARPWVYLEPGRAPVSISGARARPCEYIWRARQRPYRTSSETSTQKQKMRWTLICQSSRDSIHFECCELSESHSLLLIIYCESIKNHINNEGSMSWKTKPKNARQRKAVPEALQSIYI